MSWWGRGVSDICVLTRFSVGAHEYHEAAIAVCLIHRHRWPLNLGELPIEVCLKKRRICRSELARDGVC